MKEPTIYLGCRSPLLFRTPQDLGADGVLAVLRYLVSERLEILEGIEALVSCRRLRASDPDMMDSRALNVSVLATNIRMANEHIRGLRARWIELGEDPRDFDREVRIA